MILEIKNGCFGYPKQDIILADINLSLEEGHILAILGPNGIGKTTLLKCMIGLLPWREGATFLYGQDIKTKGIVEQFLLHSAEPRFCFFLHRTGNGHARPLFASWHF